MLARENLKEVMNFKDPSETDSVEIAKFDTFLKNAKVYKAYQQVVEFLNRPLKVEKYPGYNRSVYFSARAILGFSQK